MSISKLILPVLGVFIFLSCNKYPEGPKFTLLGRKDRMEGTWDLRETHHSDGSVTYDSSADVMELTEDYEYFYRSGVITISGTWDFDNNKEKVSFKVANSILTYTILRLKDKEIWLKDEIDGDVMRFKNVEED